MKKILLFLLVIALSIPAMAQMGPLPIDSKVRKGVLPNGLTYYVRQNAEPKGQAEFFIAQKVGSVQEEDNQRGLAHFLEHMAFNGLQHFPGKDLFKFTEGIGVRFGYNLNAYTSLDETVYNISAVPVSREGIIDTCLLILFDWANGLTLLDKDIQDERGVIREEMRTRTNATMRIYDQIVPVIYPNNRYGQRMPIGTEEVLMGFKPEELRAYYEKWYRPDHQGIAVVGDFDPDVVEAKIKELFGTIPTPETPSELAPLAVEPNEEPIVAIGTDKEMTQTQITINFKNEAMPKELKLSAVGVMTDYMTEIISRMLNTRLNEITQKANPPFIWAAGYYGPFFISKTVDAFTLMAGCKEDGTLDAYKVALTELARMKQHGFTASEYERAKEEYLSELEKLYKERDKRKSVALAQECINNFKDDKAMPGLEQEYAILNQLIPALPLENINEVAKQLIHDNDLVIMITGPQKEGLTYPTKEELLSLYKSIMETEQEAYKDEVLDEPLIAQLPKAGKVTKTADLKLFEAKEFTLSNGIRVIIKPTDFKEDEIRFTATSFGGNSLMNDKDIITFKVLNEIATVGGVGNFSRVNLNKALAGKQAGARTSVSVTTEDMNGSCSPKDLETMMQLIYLYATAPRFDQEAFDSWKERLRAQLENFNLNPMKTFSDTLVMKTYGKQPRAQQLSLEDLDKVDYKKAIELYKERFKDMNDFTFTFVGNIDEATFVPLMEQYIAALPAGKRKETFKDVKVNPLPGEHISHFNREMETVKATVATVYNGKMDYTPENVMKYDIFEQIMDIVYTEEIREKEGGTYGVSVFCEFGRYPVGNYSMTIFFDTDPEKAQHLLSVAYRELEKVAKDGPNAEHFEKVTAYIKKNIEQNLRENGAWLNAIDEYAMYKTDSFTKKAETLEKIKPADIQAIAQMVLSQKNRAEIIMTGVSSK